MSKHEVTIRENTGTTKTEAPYLPQYVKKSDLDFTTLCALVAAESGLTDTQSRTHLEGAFAEFIKLEKESPVRIHVDGMTVCLTIYGSFDASDAAFDSTKNTLAVALYLDDDIKNALVDVTPAIVTEETATKVRITLVADEETPRPYELIHGQHIFEVQGYNLVMTDVGACVTLVNAAGASFSCTVVEAVSKQKLRVKSETLLEGGDYKLFVKSRGGDAEGTLQSVFRKVKYLKVIDAPTLTDVRSDGQAADTVKVNDQITLSGTRLGDYDLAAGDSITVRYKYNGEERYFDASRLIEDPSATTLKPEARLTSSCDDGTIGTVEVKIGSNTVTRPFTVLNPA